MKKIIIPGIVTGFGILVTSLLWSTVTGALFPSLGEEYQSGLFRPWTDPLMSLFFIHPFLVGIVLAYAWDMVKRHFEGGTDLSRAFRFGWWYFVIATIPGMVISYSSFKMSFLMLMTWTVSGLIEAVVAGYILGKLRK